MLGTLIGAFITASGILLSADTASTDLVTGKVLGVERKIEVIGRSSAAAINGELKWTGGADFLRVFRDVSKTLRGSAPLSIRRQADRLSAALKDAAERNARPGIQRYLQNGQLLTVTIAGFDDGQPEIVAFTIVVEGATSNKARLRFAVQEERIYPPWCWWIAGNRTVALALVNDAELSPLAIRQDLAVLAVRDVRTSSPCDALTEAQARTFFRIAVDTTIAYGAGFGLRPGVVGKPVDVLSITRGGVGQIERIN